MASENGLPAGSPPAQPLPPVEAPNVRMILQLFIVPGLLVALVIGFIVVFFGGVGAGPQRPAEFIAGLSSLSGHKRQQTAHDLAQALPRKPELRADAKFALDVTELLERERQAAKAAPPDQKKDEDLMDLLEYLPAVAGNFQAPVAFPVLEDLLRQNADKLQDQTARLRFRNAIVAIGLLGSRLAEFDAQSPEAKARILAELKKEAGDKPGRPYWADLAHQFLKNRMERQAASANAPMSDGLGVVPVLTLGARANDEMSRKLTVLALANWPVAGSDELLRQMTNPGGGIDIFEDADQERGLREIRFNAALALARRGSPLTPDDVVLDALDEAKLNKLYPDAKTSPAESLVLKALRDLREGKKADPEGFARKAAIQEAVKKLGSSPSVAIRMEATKLLGEAPIGLPQPPSMNRQLLLMIGLAGSIFVFLGIAVIARWRRKPEAAPSAA